MSTTAPGEPQQDEHVVIVGLAVGGQGTACPDFLAFSFAGLSPKTREALADYFGAVLEVARAGERHSPGDQFLKVFEENHMDHATLHIARHLRARVQGTGHGRDPITGYPDVVHAGLRLAFIHHRIAEPKSDAEQG